MALLSKSCANSARVSARPARGVVCQAQLAPKFSFGKHASSAAAAIAAGAMLWKRVRKKQACKLQANLQKIQSLITYQKTLVVELTFGVV